MVWLDKLLDLLGGQFDTGNNFMWKAVGAIAMFPTSVQDSSEYNELPVRHSEDNMNR